MSRTRSELATHVGNEGVDRTGAASVLEALELLTVDDAGWPHVAWLSAGEVIALRDDVLAFCIWPHSTTRRNLDRDGRAVLQAVVEGVVLRYRLDLEPMGDIDVAGAELACYRARVSAIDRDEAAYADVLAGPTYRLTAPDEAKGRWRAQVRLLTDLAQQFR